MGRFRDVTRARSAMAEAIRRCGRAPGRGPGTVKRLAHAWQVSRQYAHRVIEGEGCLQAAREYLHRMVGGETSPLPVVEAVRWELVAAMAMRSTDQELVRRLRAARAESIASRGPAELAVWLHQEAPDTETLEGAISALHHHLWDMGELLATLQAMRWRDS